MERKFFAVKVLDVDEAKLIVRHFISTDMEDRSGDVMEPGGMQLDGVPSVLKQHGQDPDVGGEPIAKCLGIEVGTDNDKHKGLIATTQYYDGSHLIPPDNTGRRLFEKAKDGFMPYWSIGFAAEKWNPNPKGNGGRHITRWHLYEYSQVGVPDNVSAKSIKPEEGESLVDFQVPSALMADGLDLLEVFTEEDVKDLPLADVKPYPNEHACRLLKPLKDAATRRKNGEGEHDGKKYDVIYQKQKDGKWKRQAFRYPKKSWTVSEARAHCKSHKGILFEPASGDSKSLERVRAEVNYNALHTVFYAFVDSLFGVTDVKKAQKLLKELVSLLEPYTVGLVEEFARMADEEEVKSLRERLVKMAEQPDEPPASEEDAPPEEESPAPQEPGEEPPAEEPSSTPADEPPAPDAEPETESEDEETSDVDQPPAAPEEEPPAEADAPKFRGKDFILVDKKPPALAPKARGIRVTGLKSRAELADTVSAAAGAAVQAELDRAKGRVE